MSRARLANSCPEPGEGGGRLRLGASRIIADGLGALDQQRLGGIVKSAIADRLRELDVAPLLGQALQAALAEGGISLCWMRWSNGDRKRSNSTSI